MMSNYELLKEAYLDERNNGFPWHNIVPWLIEHHVAKSQVMADDNMTAELIAALPSLRCEAYSYNGTGMEVPTEAFREKQSFYNSIEWRQLKQYIWDNTPTHICPYCGMTITGHDWTIHHKLYTEDNIEQYKSDKDINHYSIMHIECHRQCHEILGASFNRDEITKLTSCMGEDWIKASLRKEGINYEL